MYILLCSLTAAAESLPWWGEMLIGVVATFIALFVTYLSLHPRIRIFPYAAMDSDGHLHFLIRNVGIYSVYNVQMKLRLCHRDESGSICSSRSINEHSITKIDGRYCRDERDICDVPMGESLSLERLVGSWLELEVLATHRISNTTNVIVQVFQVQDIYEGAFSHFDLVDKYNQKLLPPSIIDAKCNKRIIIYELLQSIAFCLIISVNALMELGWCNLHIVQCWLLSTILVWIVCKTDLLLSYLKKIDVRAQNLENDFERKSVHQNRSVQSSDHRIKRFAQAMKTAINFYMKNRESIVVDAVDRRLDPEVEPTILKYSLRGPFYPNQELLCDAIESGQTKPKIDGIIKLMLWDVDNSVATEVELRFNLNSKDYNIQVLDDNTRRIDILNISFRELK